MALRKRDDYRSDRLTVTSIIHSHVGAESRARVIEENLSLAPGDTKDLDDTLDNLRLLLTTHYKDARANSSIVLDDAMKAFTNISNQEETETNFYQKWKVVLQAYNSALSNNGVAELDIAARIGMKTDHAIKFIRSLDKSRYGDLI